MKDTRDNFLHKLSTEIICENQTIVFEDLFAKHSEGNVSGMVKKRCDPATTLAHFEAPLQETAPLQEASRKRSDPAPPTARLRNAHSCEGMLTKRGNAHQETVNYLEPFMI
nr:hypothetical protein [Okeania sp. SIO2F4]